MNQAVFDIAYKIVISSEGYYANNPADPGGETYAGIARNFYPYFSGWPVVDTTKYASGGTLPNNYHIAALDSKVREFYYSLWIKSRITDIHYQPTANLAFDFYVHSRKAVSVIQSVLVKRGFSVAVDNMMGPASLAAINSDTDQRGLHDAIKRARIAYVTNIARTQGLMQFLPAWLARIAKFSSQKRLGMYVVGGLIIAAGTYVLYKQKYRNEHNS
jgi:lysozyme family protein